MEIVKNAYLPGDTIFLYASFQPGINIISEKEELRQNISTDESKNGLYINGQWVTYDQYMRYYSNILMDSAWDSTYYAYNTYFSNAYLGGYNNWVSNYYVHSLEDISANEILLIEQIKHTMQFRILHDEDGIIYEDFDWTDMFKLNDNEFYYNYCVPFDLQQGEYQVVYKSIYKKSYYNAVTKEYYTDEQLKELNFNKINEDKVAYTTEKIHIILPSQIYEDTVKVFGNVNYKKTTIPAEDVYVSIYETNTNNKIYQSLTNREGYWEAYLYPNQYKFVFSRNGYIDETIYAEINDDANYLPFQIISLGTNNENFLSKGNGLFRIFDQYISKTGLPLAGLTVSIYNALDPTTIIAQDTTNNEGFWEVFLNDGFYILKLSGTVFDGEFDRVFRLKVLPDGKYFFDHLTRNILTDTNMDIITRGTGKIEIKDVINDRWGNPINDVQVNIYNLNTELQDKNILAQDYTNGNGQYILYVDPGTYIFEYYHPNFTTITETKIIDKEGNITTIEEKNDSTNTNTTDNSKYTNYYINNITYNNINYTDTVYNNNYTNNLILTSQYINKI